MPVLTPAELWETSGRNRDPGDLPRRGSGRPPVHPAADARGDGHVSRARDPVVQAAAAALVPLPDEGSRRAAAARRAPPRPRVHHEGRVLVRPRRGGRRRSFERNVQAYKQIFARCGLEMYDVQAESGMMGGKFSVDFLAPVGLGREHARHVRERRLRGRRRHRAGGSARARRSRPRSRARGDRDAGRRRRSRRSQSSSASTRRRRRRRCR